MFTTAPARGDDRDAQGQSVVRLIWRRFAELGTLHARWRYRVRHDTMGVGVIPGERAGAGRLPVDHGLHPCGDLAATCVAADLPPPGRPYGSRRPPIRPAGTAGPAWDS